MVRRIWQNRLVLALNRPLRLFLRWLLIWLDYLTRRARRSLRVTGRFLRIMVRPRDPNNLFLEATEASHAATEGSIGPLADIASGERGASLLWAAGAAPAPIPQDGPVTSGISLWRGSKPTTVEDAATGATAANRRYAYIDLMTGQIRKLSPRDIKLLEELIQRLARKWLDIDETFEQAPRRNRLDIGRTLRYNIPRYAGAILNFKWAIKEYPLPELAKPARILVIGDVSHSMVHYVSVLLFFFHSLNFKFVVESYVFSERATHSTPFLNGLGTFEEKVQRLIQGAKSWNAGTRFGSALEEIADTASVDENTYVLIATDGKVSLQTEEAEKIRRYMSELRRRAKQVIFVTPSVDFSGSIKAQAKPVRLGTFKYGFQEIPIWTGSPVWYGTLGQYADQIYLIRTVHDLIDMTENLLLSSHQQRRKA
ncbi:MAG: VWA domain-containing protein [Bacillota bacterium]